ncbi:MAG: prepilin peptidase [Candidatus Woesearchaeota archaeon]
MVWELVVLIGLVIGSVTDIVRREVPDMLNYSLLAIGFLLALLYSYNTYSFTPLLNASFGFIVAYIISMILFKTGQWGGGDTKMLWGIGALAGFSLAELPFPFLLIFLVYSMIAGAVYGFLWLIYLAIKHRLKFLKEFKELKSKKSIKYLRYSYLAFGALILIYIAFFNPVFEIMVLLFLLLAISIITLYSFLFVKAVESKCLVKNTKVEDLVPGDWITNDFKVNGKKFECEKIGVTEEQIAYLKKHKIKFVETTEGIPFVPAFLLAFLII